MYTSVHYKIVTIHLSGSRNFHLFFRLKANKIIARCNCNEVHMDTLKANSDSPIGLAYLDECMSCIQINKGILSLAQFTFVCMTDHHLHHLCRQAMTSKINFLLLVSSQSTPCVCISF